MSDYKFFSLHSIGRGVNFFPWFLNLENQICSHMDQIRICGATCFLTPGPSKKRAIYKETEQAVWCRLIAKKHIRDNDTSVIRGPVIMKAGRLDSYVVLLTRACPYGSHIQLGASGTNEADKHKKLIVKIMWRIVS